MRGGGFSPHTDAREEFLKRLVTLFAEIETTHGVSATKLLDNARPGWGKRLRERVLNSRLALAQRNVSPETFDGIVRHVLTNQIDGRRIRSLELYYATTYRQLIEAHDGRTNRVKAKPGDDVDWERFIALLGRTTLGQIQNDAGLLIERLSWLLDFGESRCSHEEAVKDVLAVVSVLKKHRARLKLDEENKWRAVVMAAVCQGSMIASEADDVAALSVLQATKKDLFPDLGRVDDPVVRAQFFLSSIEYYRALALQPDSVLTPLLDAWRAENPPGRFRAPMNVAHTAVELSMGVASCPSYFSGRGLESAALLGLARAVETCRLNVADSEAPNQTVFRVDKLASFWTLDDYIRQSSERLDAGCLREHLPALLIASAREKTLRGSEGNTSDCGVQAAVRDLDNAWDLLNEQQDARVLAYCDWYIAVARVMELLDLPAFQTLALDIVSRQYAKLGYAQRHFDVVRARNEAEQSIEPRSAGATVSSTLVSKLVIMPVRLIG